MLRIQDPSFADSELFHEALLDSFRRAKYGAGAYAFVSREGADLVFDDPIFKSFIETGEYHLIAGTDEITNTAQIDALHRYTEKHKGLKVNAFLNDAPGSLFHPKFSWFKCESGGIIIVGSGNLTQRGLRRNQEAFVLSNVSEEEISEVESLWNKWVNDSAGSIFDILDENIRDRAAQNTAQLRKMVKRIGSMPAPGSAHTQSMPPTDVDEEEDAWSFGSRCPVLIAEIPRGKNRWNQANFDVGTYRSYFGIAPFEHGEYRVVTRAVAEDGRLGEIKIRGVSSNEG